MIHAVGDTGAVLRIGVVGAGLISTYHLNALAVLPQARIEAVVASRLARARDRAEQYGARLALTDWRDLSGVVDAAIVATPDETHVEIAEGLVDAGVAVLVQKPIATSFAEARTLVARARPGMLSASFMHRYLGATIALAELIRSGRLGGLMSARVRNATPGPDWGAWFFEASGPTAGVVGQLGVHGIDLVEHLLGEIQTVQAMTATRMSARVLSNGEIVESRVPDHALAHYRLTGGALVSHEQCWAEAGGTERFRMEIHGEDASVEVRSPIEPLLLFARGGGSPVSVPVEHEPVAGYRHHQAWLDAVSERRDDGTAQAAVRGLAVAEAIAASAAASCAVAVADGDE